MEKHIAILRGINVGGKRKILMADLKALFRDLGFSDVETYIQSGNVLFTPKTKGGSGIELSKTIEKAISDKFGFDVPVIVRSITEIGRALGQNPFYKEKDIDIDRLHLTFLKEIPTEENRLKTENHDFKPDDFIINGKDIYVFCAGKYHQSKLTNNFFESHLKVPATTRNWKTVLKLMELGG